MKRRQAIACVAGLAVMPLSACGADKAVVKIAKVVMDPSVPVGEPGTQPSIIHIDAYAAAEMNRNFEGEPSPVVLKIFALSSDHRLFGYDFFSIAEDTAGTLGVTLLEELDEAAMLPDSYKVLGPYELPKKTKKIGIVAEYLDIETAVWRASVDVKAVGQDDRFLLLLTEEEVRLMKKED